MVLISNDFVKVGLTRIAIFTQVYTMVNFLKRA